MLRKSHAAFRGCAIKNTKEQKMQKAETMCLNHTRIIHIIRHFVWDCHPIMTQHLSVSLSMEFCNNIYFTGRPV